MSMMNISGLGVSFGDYDVFSGFTASIPRGAKIGLVGANGVGKTTLLGVLAGVTPPATGTITLAQGTRVGYLRQEAMEAFGSRSAALHDEMLAVFAELRQREATLRELEQRMAESSQGALGNGAGSGADALFEEYSAAQEAFERAGGYSYEWWIDQVLQGLGFRATTTAPRSTS